MFISNVCCVWSSIVTRISHQDDHFGSINLTAAELSNCLFPPDKCHLSTFLCTILPLIRMHFAKKLQD